MLCPLRAMLAKSCRLSFARSCSLQKGIESVGDKAKNAADSADDATQSAQGSARNFANDTCAACVLV